MTRRMRALSSIFLAFLSYPVFAENAAPPSFAASETEFLGHYYLGGIREVGSELLLRADGGYDWFLAYGSTDQLSNGTWKRVGDEIVLLAHPVDQSGPWFSLGEIGAWNEAFEQDVQDAAFAEGNAAVAGRCKFLADGEFVGTPVASAISAYNEKVTAAELQAAAKAEAEEVAARARYEAAALAAMAGDASSTELHDAARTARYVWLNALDSRYQARGTARLPYEERLEARLPEGCQYEDRPQMAGHMDKAKWTNGVGVFVHDPETGNHFNRIDVRFQFAGGGEVEKRIESGGRTWVPATPDRKVVGIIVKIEFEGETHAQAFQLPPMKSGAISVILQTSKLVAPAFDEMRLKIDGKSLVGFDGRGRYDRAP
jgi:hypothetical protein